jgi:hypothetical protein
MKTFSIIIHQLVKLKMVLLWLIALMCLLNLSGCIQHRFLTIIHPDGSVTHTYEASGDSADLYDNKITLPSGFWWKIETETSVDTSGQTVYTYRAKLNVPSARNIPESYAPEVAQFPEILLRHPIDIERYDALIGILFRYHQTFINRQKDAKYGNIWDTIDPECRILLDDTKADSLPKEEKERLQALYLDGLIAWSRQMIVRRCHAILKRDLELHPNIALSPEQIKNAEQSVESFTLQWMPEDSGMSILLGEDDLWETLGKPALNNMTEELRYIGDSSFQADLVNLADMYQWEYDITKDLEDDEFQVKIILPGYYISDNAKEKNGDTLSWEFSGKDFYNENVLLKAQSIYVRWIPMSIFGLVVLGLIIWLLRRKPTPPTPIE